MPGGRPPKPTQLKVLAGNPGKRPLNADEPQYPTEGLTCPRDFDAETRREWRRVAKLLTAQRVVTAADRGVMAVYCVSWSRWRQVETDIQVEGLTVEVPILNTRREQIGTRRVVNPKVLIAQQYQRLMLLAAGRLGLDPSSRSKVSVVKDEAPNPILELIEGGRKTGS